MVIMAEPSPAWLLKMGPDISHELLSTFGDDVTYWDDNGDVYGASFGQVRARESQVQLSLPTWPPDRSLGRVQASLFLAAKL